jgi:hypothetical protein
VSVASGGQTASGVLAIVTTPLALIAHASPRRTITTRTVATPTPPSSSVTVTSTVCGPNAVNAWVVAQVPVPEPGVSVTAPVASGVPSPKFTPQVWPSLWPASVNGAVKVTMLPRTNSVPPAGAETLTVGATLASLSGVVTRTGALMPSAAVNVSV